MKLTEETFLSYALRNYDNIQCVSLTEFEEDLKRFTYLKKLFYRYKNENELCERMILNHLIVLFNVFGEATVKMLYFKMENELLVYLNTFLIYLKRISGEDSDIPVDELILDKLKDI